jgi:hypothetical protein
MCVWYYRISEEKKRKEKRRKEKKRKEKKRKGTKLVAIFLRLEFT